MSPRLVGSPPHARASPRRARRQPPSQAPQGLTRSQRPPAAPRGLTRPQERSWPGPCVPGFHPPMWPSVWLGALPPSCPPPAVSLRPPRTGCRVDVGSVGSLVWRGCSLRVPSLGSAATLLVLRRPCPPVLLPPLGFLQVQGHLQCPGSRPRRLPLHCCVRGRSRLRGAAFVCSRSGPRRRVESLLVRLWSVSGPGRPAAVTAFTPVEPRVSR